MADYSGATSGNITINDGDTIGATNTFTVSLGDTVTVTAGATVPIYAGRWIEIYGTFNAIGTLANNITFKAQGADPDADAWASIRIRANEAISTLYYVIIEGADISLLIYDFPSATVSWTKIWFRTCERIFYVNSDVTDASWVFENWYSSNSSGNLTWDTNSAENTVVFRRIWRENTTTNPFYVISNGTIFDQCVCRGFAAYNYLYSLNINTIFSQNYMTYCNSSSCFRILHSDTNCSITDSIFYNIDCDGLACANATNSYINSSYNDFINLFGFGLNNIAGELNSDYDYLIGCANRPPSLVDTGENTQVSNLTTRTNIQSVPNHPLTVDNISEGSPDTSSITITYDCSANAVTSKRLYGLPFIRYGTSSGVYDMQSYLPSSEEWGLYWINWYTDFEWKQTGHSVTISNLKGGTKYYYQCCFVDPFGRIGVSAEGDFTTSSAADFPSEDDVRDGVTYDIYEGNLELPAIEDVEGGVSYGTNGTEYTGTYAATTPTFAGITGLERIAPGELKVSWSAGSDLTHYKIFVRSGEAPTVADDTYLWGLVDGDLTSTIINTIADNDTLLDGTSSIYVIVRAYNVLAGAEDSNTTGLNLTPQGGKIPFSLPDTIVGI